MILYWPDYLVISKWGILECITLCDLKLLSILKLTVLGQEHAVKRKQERNIEPRPTKVLKISPGNDCMHKII